MQGAICSEDINAKIAAEKKVEAQRLVAKQQAAQKRAEVASSRANHKYVFGQIIPFIADLRAIAQTKAVGLQDRVQARIEGFRTGNETTQPQRLPERGTGRAIGTAREPSWPPLTRVERTERHKRIFGTQADHSRWTRGEGPMKRVREAKARMQGQNATSFGVLSRAHRRVGRA